MPTITSRALRGSALVAAAAAGVLGLAACSGGAAPEPSTSASEAPATSAEPTTSESPAEEAAGGGTTCTEEQFATLTSAAGQSLPAEAYAVATADFQPAAVIGSLPTACVFAIEQAGISASFAVLPGGAATLATVAEQSNAAGGQVTEAGGAITGTVEDVTIAGIPFTQFTQETAGFEDVDDLVVVVGTSALG